MPDRSRWHATSAWDEPTNANLGSPSHPDDVRIDLLEHVEAATIIVQSGQDAELDRRVRTTFGCGLPPSGRVGVGRGVYFVWSAPGQWFAVATDDQTLTGLAMTLAGAAAVTDQGDARAIARVSGPLARDLLAKGVAIDLHPSVFKTGCTAMTKVAHVSVQLWQIDEVPTYIVAVPRSFTGSIRSWLAAASVSFASTSK